MEAIAYAGKVQDRPLATPRGLWHHVLALERSAGLSGHSSLGEMVLRWLQLSGWRFYWRTLLDRLWGRPRCPCCRQRFNQWFEWDGLNYCWPCYDSMRILTTDDGAIRLDPAPLGL